jgi:hypothetical protein
MEAVKKHCRAEEPERQKEDLKAQTNECKAKQDKPIKESPATEVMQENCRAEEPDCQKVDLETQINECKAKQESTEIETLQIKAGLQKTTESLRLIKERIRDVRPTQWPTQQQFDAMKVQYDEVPHRHLRARRYRKVISDQFFAWLLPERTEKLQLLAMSNAP